MLEIDRHILQYFNSYAGRSETVDRIIAFAFQTNSVRFLPLVALLVWLWAADASSGRRAAVVQGVVGALVALTVSRLIQNLSPHRPRPLHSESFVLPYGVAPDTLSDWSSFPSDTTALAFALAAGIWCASRPLGWASFVWSAVVVALPRVYGGLHYPSDIIGGAFIGVSATLACGPLVAKGRLARELWSAESRMPALFYSICFVLLFQIATAFADARRAAILAASSFKSLVSLFDG